MSTTTEGMPETRRNALLRKVDWRFLLRQEGRPRALPLDGRPLSADLALVAEEAGAGAADVVVLGYPTRRALEVAVAAAAPGGAIVCRWGLPRPFGAQRAQRRLRRAGLSPVGVYWPGPLPRRQPQFWLRLGSREALARLFDLRPPRSRRQTTMRLFWRGVARLGLLAPAVAVGHACGASNGGVDAPAGGEGDGLPLLLLTGGARSINKVVALSRSSTGGPQVVKFARVAEADAALEREAEVLSHLAVEHPGAEGIPHLLAQGQCAGRRAISETAIAGRPLIESLTEATFPQLASRVTAWLVELARGGERRAAAEWQPRLVAEPLRRFEEGFGALLDPGTAAHVKRRLEDLDELPQTCEHRDCSPWNVVLSSDGTPALLDWESAEPHGLPGLDLAYFLATSAFILDGALESGRTDESYASLLDPGSPRGGIAARCAAEYCAELGLDPATFPALRLLAWIVHSHSDYRHAAMETGGQPVPKALRESVFLGLVELELGSEGGRS